MANYDKYLRNAADILYFPRQSTTKHLITHNYYKFHNLSATYLIETSIYIRTGRFSTAKTNI